MSTDETLSQMCSRTAVTGVERTTPPRAPGRPTFQGRCQPLAGWSPMSNAIQYHPFAFDVQNRRLTFEEEGRAWDAECNSDYS